MYDNIRSTDYDFKNCKHVACSEVRAAKLAGYCSDSFSYFSNSNSNNFRNQTCARNKAFEHISTYYDHCGETAMNDINSVFEKCYSDNTPLDFTRERPFLNI
jgi:inner membrane protease ATP23